MGAHYPLPFLNENMLSKFAEEIVRPVLRGVENMGHVYKGFLYCGLMVVRAEKLEYSNLTAVSVTQNSVTNVINEGRLSSSVGESV